MLIVQNSIITDDIALCRFGCNLAQCKGRCCVEGDYGAPLLEAEIGTLQDILPAVEPYMTAAGRQAVAQHGVCTPDDEGHPCTTLVGGHECAFATPAPDGTTLCAIESAYRNGKCHYLKPISCHLYPLRVEDYGTFITINYHRWDVCQCAAGQGQPLYITLQEPLVRRFGRQWYDELLQEIKNKPPQNHNH